MSNLGTYQVMTTVAKQVGGPGVLVAGLILTGGLFFYGIDRGLRAIKNNKDEKRKKEGASVVYHVKTEAVSNEGLEFSVGDTFRVLEKNQDVGTIVKGDDENTHYYVSLAFLSKISNY